MTRLSKAASQGRLVQSSSRLSLHEHVTTPGSSGGRKRAHRRQIKFEHGDRVQVHLDDSYALHAPPGSEEENIQVGW
ncbi:unnamed protein product [Heterosigma akashiwo]